MKKKVEAKVGTMYVSNKTGNVYLLTQYNLGTRKFTLEFQQGWLTLTYRQGLTLEQAIAIEYEPVGRM